MRRPCTIFAVLLTLAVFGPAGNGSISLTEQAVTFADFSFIRDIAASISHVYFATTNGITRYNKNTETWEDPITPEPDMAEVERIWVDTFDEKLLVRTGLGYHEYNIRLDNWYTLPEPIEIRSDNRHLPTPEHMLPPFGHNFSSDAGIIDDYGRAYPISDVVDESTGTLWLGTWGKGAGRANAVTNQIELMPFGLLQSRVDAIYREGDTLWLGGAVNAEPRTGITKFDLESYGSEFIESGLTRQFPLVDVYSLSGTPDILYAGTQAGLYSFDRRTMQVERQLDSRHGLPSDIILAVEAINDSVFVGTAHGIALVTGGGDSLTAIAPGALGNRYIYDFEVIGNDLWIAAENGAFRFLLDSGRLQRFTDPTNILFGGVYEIRRHGDFIWLVADDGVVQVNLVTADVIPYSNLQTQRGHRALAVNDEVAAISADYGLELIYYQRENPIFAEITVQDGLPSGNVYALEMDGDYIWVGTDEGLTRFLWNNPRRVD